MENVKLLKVGEKNYRVYTGKIEFKDNITDKKYDEEITDESCKIDVESATKKEKK